MNLAAELWPFLGLGLAGAAHCAGMCGGFAAAVSARRDPTASAALRQLAYLLGKATTYALLGVSAALAGGLLAHGGAGLVGDDPGTRARALESLRGILAWMAGGMLVLFGLASMGFAPPARLRPAALERLLAPLARGLRSLASLPGYAGALGLGLSTGFLPCGLSWAALVLAATTNPAVAGLGLFVFGLATAPALVAAALGWRFLGARRRVWAARLAGPLLVAFGLYTGLRGGLPVGEPLARGALPECCAPPSDGR